MRTLREKINEIHFTSCEQGDRVKIRIVSETNNHIQTNSKCCAGNKLIATVFPSFFLYYIHDINCIFIILKMLPTAKYAVTASAPKLNRQVNWLFLLAIFRLLEWFFCVFVDDDEIHRFSQRFIINCKKNKWLIDFIFRLLPFGITDDEFFGSGNRPRGITISSRIGRVRNRRFHI